MAQILKSNARYTGTDSLLSVKQLSMSAAEIYAEYAARVVADGGEIINATRTQAAVNFVHGRKMFGKFNGLVGASYGIKRSGTNVSKLYSIDGMDLDMYRAGGSVDSPQYDTALAYPRIRTISTAATVGAGFSTATKKTPSRHGRLGIAYVGVNDPAYPRPLYAGYSGGVGSGQTTSLVQLTNNASLSLAMANSAWTTTSSSVQTVSNTNVEGKAHCMYSDTVLMKNTMYADGALAVQGPTTSLSDQLQTLEQFLTLGLVINSASTSPGAGLFAEFWAMRDMSESDAAAISAHLGAIY